MTEPIALTLGRFIAEADLRSPAAAPARRHASWQLLDALALGVAAWTAPDGFARTLTTGLVRAGDGGACTVLGSGISATPATAALINGALIHGWEYDDVDRVSAMHCQAFTGAAALAVAEERGAPGADVLDAFLIGEEVAQRMALAVTSEGGLFRAGFHTSGVFGAFGAAAAAARLMGLDATSAAHALALAVSFASGSAQGWSEASGRNKTLQPGWAAHSGVTAALLAGAGYECSLTTMDGPRGLYSAYTSGCDVDLARITDGLGEVFKAEDLGVKLFPCGAVAQGAVEAAVSLTADGVFTAESIRSGTIRLPAQFAGPIASIGDALYRPSSGYAAIGSVPLVVARALTTGTFQLEDLSDDVVTDPGLLTLTDRLVVEIDAANAALPVDERPITLVVRTPDGELTAQVVREAGHPSRLTEGAVVRKALANLRTGMGEDAAAQLVRDALRIDEVADIRSLTARLRG